MIPTLLSLLIFPSTEACVQYMDKKLTTTPNNSTVSYVDMTKAMVILYGAVVVVKCDNKVYTAEML